MVSRTGATVGVVAVARNRTVLASQQASKDGTSNDGCASNDGVSNAVVVAAAVARNRSHYGVLVVWVLTTVACASSARNRTPIAQNRTLYWAMHGP